jgi:DNA-binding transcriptional ArsR family regulator
MTEIQTSPELLQNELLTLLKAVADKNRLRIIGILAHNASAVEDIASSLKIGASTVSHHLSVLAKAGLVEGRVDGYYSVYSLKTDPLQALAKKLLQHVEPEKTEKPEGDAYEQKVFAAFLDEGGMIKAFPMQEKKYLVLLRYALRDFEHGVRYPEKKVNEMLAKYSADTARLRRGFIEYGFMAREGGGGKYWRIDKK